MAYVPVSTQLGLPSITSHSTTQGRKLGGIIQAVDPTYGAGEFIYLKGLDGTTAGLVVTYVASTGVTALGTTSGVATGGAPVAVAMSACVTGEYGWYQIGGSAVVLKTAVKVDPASGNRVYLSATAGRVMQTSVAGRQILGARFEATTTVTSTTSTALVTLNRPSQKSGTAV